MNITDLPVGVKKQSPLELLMAMSQSNGDLWSHVNQDYVFRENLISDCERLADAAYIDGDTTSLTEIHTILSHIYDADFSSANISTVDSETQPIFRDIAARLEDKMLKHEYSKISSEEIESYPHDGDDYVKWLKKMISNHESSVHPLYNDYIAKEASSEDIAFYLAQETNLDPRFDDILALMQVGTHGAEKMEIANNYYDEMGNGDPKEVHTYLFAKALSALGIDKKYIQENMLLDALISGNLSSCISLSRRHYFKSVGYFGVTEYLAPRRFKHVVSAWNRNKLPEENIIYHKLHIEIDTVHAKGWLNNIISPLVNHDPAIGREIALGAMIRLNSSEQYLDALHDKFLA